MNLHNPHLRSIDPSNGPDPLAEGAINGLSRPFGAMKAWSLFRTTLHALLTFGLGPLLTLPQRFREFVMMEQAQYWHLAKWLELNSQHPDAPNLCEEAEGLKPRYDFHLLAFLGAAFVAVIFFTQLGAGHGFSNHWFSELLESTWFFPREYPQHLGIVLARKLYITWCVGLGVGYLCYHRQVSVHESMVKEFVQRLNGVMAATTAAPIRPSSNRFPGKQVWVLGAVAFGLAGAWWGIPMVVAAAAHRRYILRTSVVMRAAIAQQFRELLHRHDPSMRVPLPVYLRHRCGNSRCRAEIPHQAAFCPRCGTVLA